MTPSDEPAKIEYKRWRCKRHGYVVEVLAVHHRRGPLGRYSTVIVKGSRRGPDKQVSWEASVFLRTFKPLGRKLRVLTRWDRLRR